MASSPAGRTTRARHAWSQSPAAAAQARALTPRGAARAAGHTPPATARTPVSSRRRASTESANTPTALSAAVPAAPSVPTTPRHVKSDMDTEPTPQVAATSAADNAVPLSVSAAQPAVPHSAASSDHDGLALAARSTADIDAQRADLRARLAAANRQAVMAAQHAAELAEELLRFEDAARAALMATAGVASTLAAPAHAKPEPAPAGASNKRSRSTEANPAVATSVEDATVPHVNTAGAESDSDSEEHGTEERGSARKKLRSHSHTADSTPHDSRSTSHVVDSRCSVPAIPTRSQQPRHTKGAAAAPAAEMSDSDEPTALPTLIPVDDDGTSPARSRVTVSTPERIVAPSAALPAAQLQPQRASAESTHIVLKVRTVKSEPTHAAETAAAALSPGSSPVVVSDPAASFSTPPLSPHVLGTSSSAIDNLCVTPPSRSTATAAAIAMESSPAPAPRQAAASVSTPTLSHSSSSHAPLSSSSERGSAAATSMSLLFSTMPAAAAHTSLSTLSLSVPPLTPHMSLSHSQSVMHASPPVPSSSSWPLLAAASPTLSTQLSLTSSALLSTVSPAAAAAASSSSLAPAISPSALLSDPSITSPGRLLSSIVGSCVPADKRPFVFKRISSFGGWSMPLVPVSSAPVRALSASASCGSLFAASATGTGVGARPPSAQPLQSMSTQTRAHVLLQPPPGAVTNPLAVVSAAAAAAANLQEKPQMASRLHLTTSASSSHHMSTPPASAAAAAATAGSTSTNAPSSPTSLLSPVGLYSLLAAAQQATPSSRQRQLGAGEAEGTPPDSAAPGPASTDAALTQRSEGQKRSKASEAARIAQRNAYNAARRERTLAKREARASRGAKASETDAAAPAIDQTPVVKTKKEPAAAAAASLASTPAASLRRRSGPSDAKSAPSSAASKPAAAAAAASRPRASTTPAAAAAAASKPAATPTRSTAANSTGKNPPASVSPARMGDTGGRARTTRSSDASVTAATAAAAAAAPDAEADDPSLYPYGRIPGPDGSLFPLNAVQAEEWHSKRYEPLEVTDMRRTFGHTEWLVRWKHWPDEWSRWEPTRYLKLYGQLKPQQMWEEYKQRQKEKGLSTAEAQGGASPED